MVGVHCKWGKCNSNSRYPSKDYMQGVTFFPFPKPCQDHRLLKRDSTLQLRHDPNSCPQCCKCLVWINACRLQGFNKVDDIKKSCYICSKHFIDGKPTPQNPNPVTAGSIAPVSSQHINNIMQLSLHLESNRIEK